MTAFSYERRLQWSECDPAGIVFFPNYAKWAVDGLNTMFQSSGYAPNRKLSEEETEGIPCVEFAMRFFDAPSLHTMIRHEISVLRFGNASFTVRHRFCDESRTFAEILDTRVWAVHGKDGLRKSSLPSEVIAILNDRLESARAES